MAASKENLLSLGHLTGTETNTKQKENSLTNRVMHLQQRWQELKERELRAKRHNMQLLQQFEKTQDTLREMLACNAAMKTIRMEYERYLDESAPRWQQQLREKTQAAQRKRMEAILMSCLQNTEEQKSSADRLPPSQGLAKNVQKVSTPNENNHSSHSDYYQDISSHHPYVQSSWFTQSQTAGFPISTPSQRQCSFHVPPSYLSPASIFTHPHRLHPQSLGSTPPHPYLDHPWPRQNSPGWGSPHPEYPWSWTAGAAGNPSGSEALWGPLCTEEPLHEGGVEAETSSAPSSKRERGGQNKSSSSSQELDIKPVRLSSGHTEGSESSRDSIQTSREKRKKREKKGKKRHSSDRQRCSSQESTTTSSAVVVARVAVVQSSESDTSEKPSTSGSKRTRTRSGGLGVGLPRMEEVANEKITGNKEDPGSQKEESPSTCEESRSQTEESMSENALNQSPDDKSDSCTDEEPKSVSIQVENGIAEIEKQKRSCSAEGSSAEEKDEEERTKDLGEGEDDEEKEESQRNKGNEDSDAEEEGDDVSAKKNTTEEEEETGAEDGLDNFLNDGDNLKNEGENGVQGSAKSQDEEDGEEDMDESEPDEEEEGSVEGEEEEEEEKRSDEAEERDSEDSIISPQEHRQKRVHVIPEEAAEDNQEQKGSGTGSSDEVSYGFSEDDIEDLLAPQVHTKKKEEKDLNVDNRSEETCDVEIFQVELDNSAKTEQQSDSDEFDHFYD